MAGSGYSRRTVIAAGAAAAFTSLGRGRIKAAAPAWRRLPNENAPAPRWDHTLSADEAGRQLLVFGGRGADGTAYGDTWSYALDERAWSPIEGAGPAARFGHAVIADQKRGRIVLFGGQSAETFFNDTWQFEFASRTWSLLDSGEDSAPSPRYGLAAVLDDRGRVLVSHGFTFEGRFDDTWRFDQARGRWDELSPEGNEVRPLRRCLHELAWNAGSKTMLLYGGCSSGYGPCPQGDLWRFDPTARIWTELTPADGPAARTNPALIYDRAGKRLLLLGGLTDAGYAADLWAGRDDEAGFVWSQLATDGEAPSARASHDAVISHGDLYLFGGIGESGTLNDLWKLSLE